MGHRTFPMMDTATACPWIRVEFVGNALQAAGTPAWEYGHRVRMDNGRKDDGLYAGWRFDGQTLHIDNDRYGMMPLFYAVEAHAITLAPSPLILLSRGVSAEFDVAAMSAFGRLGFFVGDTTPFRAIKTLPPNAHCIASAGRFEIQGRQAIAEPRERMREDVIEEYIELFRQAMIRRQPTDDAWGVPLSGGRDSRHIFFELHRTRRHPPVAVSVDTELAGKGADARIAAALCELTDTPHRILKAERVRRQDVMLKNVLTHYSSDEGAWMVPLFDWVRKECRCIYDGIGGDVLSAGLFLTPNAHAVARRDLHELANLLLTPRRTAASRRVMTALLGPQVNDSAAAQQLVYSELQRVCETGSPVSQFFFWNRTRREIALFLGAMSRWAVVYAPFLDADLFDLLASLPAEMTWDGQLHSDVIAKAFPESAEVPYARSGKRTVRFAKTAVNFGALWRELRSMPGVRSVDITRLGIGNLLRKSAAVDDTWCDSLIECAQLVSACDPEGRSRQLVQMEAMFSLQGGASAPSALTRRPRDLEVA